MAARGSMAIREIARRIGREVRAVLSDVRVLLRAGILEKFTEGSDRTSGRWQPRKEAVSELDRAPVTVGDRMSSWRRNHYVPECYQKSFFSSGISERRFSLAVWIRPARKPSSTS
jgi:DNA-binding Lrp family transcriptional regulator